ARESVLARNRELCVMQRPSWNAVADCSAEARVSGCQSLQRLRVAAMGRVQQRASAFALIVEVEALRYGHGTSFRVACVRFVRLKRGCTMLIGLGRRALPFPRTGRVLPRAASEYSQTAARRQSAVAR